MNFLRATEHSQSLPLTGDPERDRQLLAASADRKLRAYEAAFGSSQRDPSTEEEFTDPSLYRDFLRLDDGTLLELTRHPDLDGRVRFIQWDPSPIPDSQASATEDHSAAPEPQSESRLGQIAYVDRLAVIHGGENFTLMPLDATAGIVGASLLNAVQLPATAKPCNSLSGLVAAISQLILRCVALTETDAHLVAHFLLATWFIDRLPIAPYLALVGPPQSGKTTLLRVLDLLCRRSLFASDATSVTLLQACDQLHPTLLIDETSSIDDPVALRRLLRIGNTPGSLVLRHKQAWNVFGAKVICWRELPDDAALNSRCIILPMHAVNDPALRLPDDPEIVAAAATLQSQLLYYRLANYEKITTPAINEAIKALPPRKRELYLALAAPCLNDEESHRFLFDYLRDRIPLGNSDNSLSAAEHAVLFSLFHMTHLPEHRSQVLTKQVAARANQHLHDEREHLQLPIRRVGAILTGFAFAERRRTKRGWALALEKDDQHRLHGIAVRYGIDYQRDNMPGFTACHLCPDVPPMDPPSAMGVVTG